MAQQRQPMTERSGRVMNCSATDCGYNESRICVADGVKVDFHSDPEGKHADCETYTLNQHEQEGLEM